MELETHKVRLLALTMREAADLIAIGDRDMATSIAVCNLPLAAHKSVIVRAPIDHYLCAVQEYPVFFDALHRYTSECLVPSEDFYEAFVRELRQAKLKKDYFPKILFSPYCGSGAFTKSMHSPFGKKFPIFAYERRVLSFLVPDDSAERVVDYLQRMFRQTGSAALTQAEEGLVQMTSHPGFSEIPNRSSIPYLSPDYDALASNVFAESKDEQAAMLRLQDIVCKLERQESNIINLFPLHMVKVAPSVFVRKDSTFPGMAWDRATLRAKIIGLLEWVWHYPSVVSQLAQLRCKLTDFDAARAEALAEIIFHLESYCQRMETKYPVIVENPLRQ